ncbi:MAG: acireductone synthase [Gammaproteobacteria bacterium]|nr:MAG: acireductone synthase [Gammaproteobacteria bacterium]
MIKAIVTDIEGTTTSISFVSDILFPYARQRIRDFVIAHAEQPAVAAEIKAVREELGDQSAALSQVADALENWIDDDKKITPLKSLQGMIWKAGYEDGSLKGHLYPEVKSVLQAWKSRGLALYVYSSGSVAAQKLLFGYSEQGDLTPLFDGYFDTKIGGKKEVQSYQLIAETLQLNLDEILFLSDVKAELDAASAAGVLTVALDRQCICDGFGEHPFVHNFEQIDLH